MHICKTAGYYLKALIRRKTLNINPRRVREKSYTKVVKLRGGQHEVISPACYCPLCFHKNDFLWACSLMQDGSKWYVHLFVFQLKGPWLIDSQKRKTQHIIYENNTFECFSLGNSPRQIFKVHWFHKSPRVQITMQRYPAETYISGQKRLLTLIIIPIVVLDRGKIVWLKLATSQYCNCDL